MERVPCPIPECDSELEVTYNKGYGGSLEEPPEPDSYTVESGCTPEHMEEAEANYQEQMLRYGEDNYDSYLEDIARHEAGY